MTPDSWPLTDRDAFRGAVRGWLCESWDPALTVRQWWGRLADSGLTVPTWSKQLGGLSATSDFQQIIEDELVAVGAVAPPIGSAGVRIVGPTLRQHASPAQTSRLLRPVVRGEQAWCILFREPGGDLPNVTTRALRQASGWVVDGHKAYTTDVEMADRALLLAVTDAAVPARRGLTCLILDMNQPGVEIGGGPNDDPTRQVVTLNSAVVGADDVIGAIDGGWQVAQTALGYEQNSLSGRIRRGLVEALPGAPAGDLDRVVGDLIATHQARPTPVDDRRA